MAKVTVDESIEHIVDIDGGSLTVKFTEGADTLAISDPFGGTTEVTIDEISALRRVLQAASKLLEQ